APIGALSIGSGQSYAKQGKPYLISTIQISTNGKAFIELSAANSPATQGNLIQPAKQDQTYEKTTPEGWQVRATIKALAVTDHPDLGDGTEGVNPVFNALDMDVEISGSGDSAYLGLTADDVSANRAGVENLRGPDLQLLDHGVVVRQVTPDGPASKAGLQQGDVILSINDQKIDRYTPLNVLLSRLHPGDKVNLDVVRDTRPLKVEVTLGKR
ncbi:MAG TPA: PDZ domain-containing protein, partial [Chloroflexia bacterium]|nr:PDZ domain-containing protein [Chloroflexia bacterium]